MMIALPPLSILAAVQDSPTDMFVHPSGHELYVSGPDDVIYLFAVEEDLNALSENEVNAVLQREISELYC